MVKDNMNDLVKKEFYKIVSDAQMGITLNISLDEFSYVRFNYVENGKMYGDQSSDELYGNAINNDKEFEGELSNGSSNYMPTLKVDNKEEFFETLVELVEKYLVFYDFSRAFTTFGEDNVIKNIILTIFSNARYVDYENPVVYMKRYMNYFDSNVNLDISIKDISLLSGSSIITRSNKDSFGYETPYCFESVIVDGDDKYYLPNISYGISDNKCYIYAIQNKHKNEENGFTKKIKRCLNKVNANVIDDTDYDKEDTVLGVPPSFVFTLSIFLKELKCNGIDDVQVITFLPDRYFEKAATLEYDADSIQKGLTERLVLLCYRIKEQMKGVDINFPAYDGSYENNAGENLIIKLGDELVCDSNELLNELGSSISDSYSSFIKK